MLKKYLAFFLAAIFALGAAPATAAAIPDGADVAGIKAAFPESKLLNTTAGNSLGFSDAPKMTKYRFALPAGKDETLSVYCYDTASDMQISKGYIDGYALSHNGESVYAETELPYTWYADNERSLLLYCGTDKAVDALLQECTNNPPVGGYFAGDAWTAPFAVLSESANATAVQETAVYGGASRKYEKLGALRKGTRVEIAGCSEDGKWAHIRSENRWSCVAMADLRPDAGFTLPLLVPSSDGGNVGNGRMKAAVNVRTGPGTGYAVLRKIKKGTVVAIDELSGDWARLRYDNDFGPAWVKEKYIAWETE